MARVSYTNLGSTPFRQLLGHSPELLGAFVGTSDAVGAQLALPGDLREEVRRHLAHTRGCEY